MIYRFAQQNVAQNEVVKVRRRFKYFYIRRANDGIDVKFPGGYFIAMHTGTSYVAPVPIEGMEFVSKSANQYVEFYLSDGPISFGQTSLNSDGQVINPTTDSVAVTSLPRNINVQTEPKPPGSVTYETYYFIYWKKSATQTTAQFLAQARNQLGVNSVAYNKYVKVIDVSTTKFISTTRNVAQNIGPLVGSYCDLVFSGHTGKTENDHEAHLHVALSDTELTEPVNMAGNELVLAHGQTYRIEKMPRYLYFVPLDGQRNASVIVNTGIIRAASVTLVTYT